MPKKLSKSRKKAVRRSSNKSWIQNLFTFPVLFIVAVVGMAIFTLYYVSKPTDQVMGVSTADYVVYTQDQVDALPEKSPSAWDYPHFVRTMLWADRNSNGKWDGDEGCLEKRYSFYVNGLAKTKQNENCQYVYIKIPKCKNNNSTTVKFGKTLTTNVYKFTGIQFKDAQPKRIQYTKNKSVSLCGDSGFIDGGGYNEVNFGVNRE